MSDFLPRLIINYTEIVVTTKCTLKCRDCANLIPLYNHPYHVPLDILISSLNNLIHCVKYIKCIGILGGEPFLYPHLCEILRLLIDTEKIGSIKIITNGTVIPDQLLIPYLNQKKVYIQLNDYKISNTEIIAQIRYLFKTNDISFLLVDRTKEKWFDYGYPKFKSKTHNDLVKQFSKCNMQCHSLLNGKLFFCPRSSHGYDLKIVDDKSEYVDLLNEGDNYKEREKAIKSLLYEQEYITACRYCNSGTPDYLPIDAARQLNI